MLNRVSISKNVMLADLPYVPREACSTDSASRLDLTCFTVVTHAAIEAGWWKNYTISHFLPKKKKKVNSFPKLLPKVHPVFLPAAHLLTKIKSFKSSLDFLKNVMKKFDLLWEHWFFLKRNTSLLLNHSFRKGKEKLGDAPFSLSHSLERTVKRTGTNPRLRTTHPLDWNHCPHRTRDNAKRHNTTPPTSGGN